MIEAFVWLYGNIGNPWMPYIVAVTVFFVAVGLVFARRFWSDLRKGGLW